MPRPFLETLRELRAGRTLDELSEQLAALVVAVKDTGKPGELVLKVKVRPPKKANQSYLVIEDDVVSKIPKMDRADTVFFPTADGGLSRSDPGQMTLNLRGVDTPAEPTAESGQSATPAPRTDQASQEQRA